MKRYRIQIDIETATERNPSQEDLEEIKRNSPAGGDDGRVLDVRFEEVRSPRSSSARDDDLKKLASELAKQFVDAVEETRVRAIEECASYVERLSPCECRKLTGKAIRQLRFLGEETSPTAKEAP